MIISPGSLVRSITFIQRMIGLMGSHILISGADNLAAVDQLLDPVGAPSGDTGDGKNRRKQFFRQPQHGVDKSAVEVHIGAEYLKQMPLACDHLLAKPLHPLIQGKFLLTAFLRRQLFRILL